MLKPVTLRCGHSGCFDCYEKIIATQQQSGRTKGLCAECRHQFGKDELTINVAMRKLTNNLEVTCANKGCLWKGKWQVCRVLSQWLRIQVWARKHSWTLAIMRKRQSWLPRLWKEGRERSDVTPWMHVCQCSLPNWMRNRNIDVGLKYYFNSAWAFGINVGSIWSLISSPS